jgi:dihydrofolate reductase
MREHKPMAKFTFGMNQSLDGYVDHPEMRPDPVLFRHWIENAKASAGSIYGRNMYQVMRYWDEDHADWTDDQHEYAQAWRRQPKWVVSRTLDSVGPNAALISNHLEEAVAALKQEISGNVSVSGPRLAQRVTELGLMDEYRLYFHPVVLGRGTPFFAGVRPRLRLVATDRIGEAVIRLTYVPE